MDGEEKRHLHIAVLTQGFVRWELANYLLHLVNDPKTRLKRPFSVWFYQGTGIEGRPVSSNRNRIVRDRPTGSDLLMLDQDTVPNVRLFEIALEDRDIVICPTPIWRPHDPGDCPVRMNMNPVVEDKVMVLGGESYDELLQGGTGAIYISNRVLSHPEMKAPFLFLHDADGVTYRGEDYSFCDRARAAGFTVWSATAILCGHVDEVDMLHLMRLWYERLEEDADAG